MTAAPDRADIETSLLGLVRTATLVSPRCLCGDRQDHYECGLNFSRPTFRHGQSELCRLADADCNAAGAILRRVGSASVGLCEAKIAIAKDQSWYLSGMRHAVLAKLTDARALDHSVVAVFRSLRRRPSEIRSRRPGRGPVAHCILGSTSTPPAASR
jgi:hypothetical protein